MSKAAMGKFMRHTFGLDAHLFRPKQVSVAEKPIATAFC
jgi:hypothetical protein